MPTLEEIVGVALILMGFGLFLLAFSRAGGREGEPFEFE